MQQNQFDALFSNQNFLSADTTTSILKHLCYFRGIGQVQIQYLRVQYTSYKLVEIGMET